MIKVLKYVLVFCALLLSGVWHPAHPHSESSALSSVKNLRGSSYIGLGLAQDTEDLGIHPVSVAPDKYSYRVSVAPYEKEEDDEVISFRKLLESGNYAVVAFFPQILGILSDAGQKIPSFHQHLSLIASYRYILLQVFRI